MPAGVIGARLCHVATDWKTYRSDWPAALAIWKGGLGIPGGIAGGVIVGILLPRRRRLSIDALCALTEPGGVVSIVAKNVEVMAMRHVHEGDWAAALAAFDSDRQVNGLGVDTRGDSVDLLADMIDSRGVHPIGWYGVRLFTDGWTSDRPPTDPEDLVLEVELTASQRDPYRRLSRLFHLLGRSE